MITLKNDNIIKKLIENCIAHTKTETSQSTKITTANETFLITANHITNRGFALIKKVKDYVFKNVDYKNIKSHKNTHYFYFKNFAECELKNYVEIDVNAAYFNIALQKKYIDKEIFNYAFEYDNMKIARLVSLGSLATKKVTFDFDTEKKDYVFNNITIAETERVFFDVSHELGNIMYDLINLLPSDVLSFFWVDAIFVPEIHQDLVINYLKNKNLETKTYVLDNVTVTKENDFLFKVKTIKNKNNEIKNYFFTDNKKKLVFLQNNKKMSFEETKIIKAKSNDNFKTLLKNLKI